MAKRTEHTHHFISRQARFRFYAELNDYLPIDSRHQQKTYHFIGTPSIKDAIEAQQVPHTEVDLILIDGQSSGFDQCISGGERVSVYPVFERLDLYGLQKLRPAPLRNPCFIADVHLGKLARYLRILGFDTLYRNDYEDEEIVEIALNEKRVILTRDLGILKYRRVTHGYWLRNTLPRLQLKELILALQLENQFKPFTRCSLCNDVIEPVAAEQIRPLLQDQTRLYFSEFFQCQNCKQVYWKGSHYQKLKAWLELT
ncbi:Mut7-C ubiquitin/RNAse domain-containing protein [Endozoicomonas sp. 4G]|uniref:Mut7-C ubiquitin/RNAse domain-containing protein n=1 Tax=Endozoicomonas sp. 4G TaxID=2872754 RepID=UPI002078B777|nr:Mut7-C ubiquitin/RNAse domain-containing protein [Endozoicomonas sp. 4G]